MTGVGETPQSKIMSTIQHNNGRMKNSSLRIELLSMNKILPIYISGFLSFNYNQLTTSIAKFSSRVLTFPNRENSPMLSHKIYYKTRLAYSAKFLSCIQACHNRTNDNVQLWNEKEMVTSDI